MLQQKQGIRVRILSQEKVINMSADYLPNDSKCSCQQCDSMACFKIRYLNSGIPCTCTDCNRNRCLAWEIENELSSDLSKYVPKVLETELNCSTNDTKKITNPTNNTSEMKIQFSYLDDNLQNDNFGDPELKEVFTEEKCGALRKLTEDKYIDDPEIKDTSSNDKSDIIESEVKPLGNNVSNDLDSKKVSAKDGSNTKKICSKCKKSLTRNDDKNKQLSSNINTPLPKNKNDPETKELFSRKLGKCCSLKISTTNTKSDFPEVYQIFTNEKKNIIKCCNISKDLEMKRVNPEDTGKKCCNESKNLHNNKNDSIKSSDMDVQTITKITNIKYNYGHLVTDKSSDTDLGNYRKYTYKDVSHTKNKINTNKNIQSYEKYVSRLQSVAISYARQDYENSRAELSAQIMNVPYEEFKDSLSRRPSSTDSDAYKGSFKLEKMDIFARLKEIYKACSCKVCECIGGKSLFNRSDICNCEPCDCNDCHGYGAKLQKRINKVPHSGCPCVRCDRKDCRGVVKSSCDYASCDCKPCDCVRCTVSFTKPCSCTPCQCETCNTSIFMPQTLTVANAAKSFRQSNCDCESCECKNCTNEGTNCNYSAMTANLMREISSGKISYGNWNFEDRSNDSRQLGKSNCRCDSRHKVIRKEMKEKRPDYGMHGVYIKDNKYGKETINNNNHNTIAMFALSDNCPNSLFNYSDAKKTCECDVCECIVCKDKGKGSVKNKSLNIEIDKKKCNFNIKELSLINCQCNPCECKICKSCKSLRTEKAVGKHCANTAFDACSCTNSKDLDHNFKIINNNEKYNFKKDKPSCLCKSRECSECKNLVNLQSDDSTDRDGPNLPSNEKFYLLKKGKLLTPSMFEKNKLASYSSHIHIQPERDSLRENDLRKKKLTVDQITKLCCSKSRHNYFDNDYNQDITDKTPDSSVKIISRNSSSLNMVLKESTTKIYKNNSVNINKGMVSKIFCGQSKTNVKNDVSNTTFLGDSVTHLSSKPSSLRINKKLEYNKEMNKCSQTSLLDRQVEDFLSKTMCSSNADVRFSSAKSMSLVKLLCQERNLNVDNKRVPKFLQSLEKITLKRLMMDEENLSNIWDKTLKDDYFFDSFDKDNYSYPLNNNLLINVDQDKSETFNCEKKKEETDFKGKKMENPDVFDKRTVKPSVPKTIKPIKSKDVSNLQMVERKPNNYNRNITAKETVALSTPNKSRSNVKVANSILRSKTENNLKTSVNKINNKRHLEIPTVIDTATSAINFYESDKHIDFEQSFKQLGERISENKKGSPILRKNFFFCPEFGKNKEMYLPLLELDVKDAVKSTSLQTNTTFPYYPGIGFGNKALTRLKNEVNELLHSPLLQSSQTINSQTENFRSKSKFDMELKRTMSDATSQTKRINIVVDKEINCNLSLSRANLRQSIQNLIDKTLTNVVQRKDIEMTKQNILKDFNKAAKINYDGLKASFVGLRKVSDHTVLLRWAMPRDLANIQGYEVDGRPVKKILNPSRCMAVLTCLPHSEKLLLTIRTITNLEKCHNPVNTVVYNPKKNKSGVL